MKAERYERLMLDYEQMRLLAEESKGVIRYTTRGSTHPPEKYQVEIDIRSVVDVKKDTPRFKSCFRLNVDLKHYPDNPPRCRIAEGSPVPFHPHFYRTAIAKLVTLGWLGEDATWTDYDQFDADKGLGEYVLKIAHSLQFDEGYINPGNTANLRAINWYWMQKGRAPETFPTDSKKLPITLERKHFEIIPKTEEQPIPTGHIASADEPTPLPLSVKKFQIVESKPAIMPSEMTMPDITIVEGLKSNTTFLPDKKHRLYISNTAFNSISRHIGWGKLTHDNIVEQGGILVGKAFRDPESGIIYSIVDDAVAGESARGSSAYLEMDHATWQQMYDRADAVLSTRPRQDSYIVGWYHTHPNSLGVFMSGTDRATQSRMFSKDWQFAVVLNPQRGEWKTFFGAAATECQGLVFKKSLGKMERPSE